MPPNPSILPILFSPYLPSPESGEGPGVRAYPQCAAYFPYQP
jgi:hypothetical protein